jgi:short-subunit dehydrogenase/pimeloyl-ACP methyl ester carboxylesterase
MTDYTRQDVSFDAEGTSCAAWLYRPDGVVDPPVIVMAHGFAAIRVLRLDAYAERFAQAGFAVLVFDYRGFGASDGQPRRVINIGAQHKDWRAAIAFARRIDGVDGRRVVAWGTSFAGGHVLHLAAGGEDFAAVVAQVPHVNGIASALNGSPVTAAKLTIAGLRDQLGALLGREPYYLPAVGLPGELAMMSTPDAVPLTYRLAGDKADELMPELDVAARAALQVPGYSPGRNVHKITAPTLVQIAMQDVLTPHKVAMKTAQKIPGAEVLTYDCGHFEPYLDPFFESVVGAQIEFLTRTLDHGTPVTAAQVPRAPRRTALITGASAGLGKAFAHHLAAERHDLLLVARREDRLLELAAELEHEHGARCEVLAADLSDPAAPRRIVDHAAELGLSIDVLVNNAGMSGKDPFSETPWPQLAGELQVMVTAVTELAHLVIPGMRDNGYGRIVNLSSLAAFQPAVAGLLYSGIKSYVLHTSQALDMELKPYGINVTALCPGFTRTEFHEVMGTADDAGRLPEVLWQQPEEVVREGWDAVNRGKPVCVPGGVNKFLAASMRPVPLRAQYTLGRTLNPFKQD